MKDDWKNDFQSSFFMLIIIINDYPQNYPYEDESSNHVIMFEVILRIII